MIKHISFVSQNFSDFDLLLNHEVLEIRILHKHSLFYNVRILLFEKHIDQSIY